MEKARVKIQREKKNSAKNSSRGGEGGRKGGKKVLKMTVKGVGRIAWLVAEMLASC